LFAARPFALELLYIFKRARIIVSVALKLGFNHLFELFVLCDCIAHQYSFTFHVDLFAHPRNSQQKRKKEEGGKQEESRRGKKPRMNEKKKCAYIKHYIIHKKNPV
jgi:hypothetical protein